MSWQDRVTLGALGVTLVADVVFIVFNHVYIAWRLNRWGRHVMAFSYVLAAILIAGFLGLAWPDHPGRATVRAALCAGLALLMCQRVWVCVTHYRRGRDEQRP